MGTFQNLEWEVALAAWDTPLCQELLARRYKLSLKRLNLCSSSISQPYDDAPSANTNAVTLAVGTVKRYPREQR